MHVSQLGNQLRSHFQTKVVNDMWLREVLFQQEGVAAQFFPYQLKEEGISKIVGKTIRPSFLYKKVSNTLEDEIGFLVNIPVAHLPRKKGYRSIQKILNLLKSQSFGENSSESKEAVKLNFFVVLGINQVESIDKRVNRAFKKYIHKMPRFEGISYRVIGFKWRPVWVENGSWRTHKVFQVLQKIPSWEKKLPTHKESFQLLRFIDPQRAKFIQGALEGNKRTGLVPALRSQVPFQQIRQKIKMNSIKVAKKLVHSGKEPIYYVTMDADMKKLRLPGQEGYFTKLTDTIQTTKEKRGFIPSVISFGYQFGEEAPPLLRLAMRIDMRLRDALNAILPGSVYMPEPGTAYCLTQTGDFVKNLKTFSFLMKGKKDQGGFESRRALSNGIEQGLFNRNHILFDSRWALHTAIPSRMLTTACKKYSSLQPNDLKKKEVLKALRGISQTHFAPLDWAHYVYEAISHQYKGGQGSHGKCSGQLSHIFSVFDPISLIINYEASNRISFSDAFDLIFSVYNTHSQKLFDFSENHRNVMLNHRTMEAFFSGQKSLLQTAQAGLREGGLSQEMTLKLIEAARASGKVIFQVLSEECNNAVRAP